jgi:hypothetical protein
MFSVKNINFILAIFFICSIINLVVMVLLKTNIIKFINTIFKSKHNQELNWTMKPDIYLKILTTATLTSVVIIIILANNTNKLVKCLNKAFTFIKNNDSIFGITQVPLSKLLCIGAGITILYFIFGILLVSISKVNIRDTILNTDILGLGKSIEKFASNNIEGLKTQQNELDNTNNINTEQMFNLKDGRNIEYGSKLSNYIEKIGSIIFADRFKCKPECCTLNKNLSTGCLCVKPDDMKFIDERGGNHKLENTFLNSFVDMKDTAAASAVAAAGTSSSDDGVYGSWKKE